MPHCRCAVAKLLLLLLMTAACGVVQSHGGVVSGEDQCIIEIGVYRAHFTIYQPETRGNEEFCEDVPDAAYSMFVMDYLHDSLREVPVDFRVIRDVLDRTIYASAEDLARIDDLEAATVYYQAPGVHSGNSFMAAHEFTDSGWYVGVVTAGHPSLDKTYTAVFGFHVGARDWGFWPWVILGLLAVQLQYWIATGGLRRWREKRALTAECESKAEPSAKHEGEGR